MEDRRVYGSGRISKIAGLLIPIWLGATAVDAQTTITHRLTSIAHDYDANGVADALSTIEYDAQGRPTATTYTYVGDGVPDLFVTEDDEAATEDGIFVFDAQGFVSSTSLDRVNMSTSTESFDVVQTFTAGRLTRLDSDADVEGAISSTYATFDYVGDDLDLVTERRSADDAVQLTVRYDYGGAGLPDTVTLSSPGAPPFPGLEIVSSFGWRADGQADDVSSVWTQGAMVVGAGSGDYVYDAQGRRIAEVFEVDSGQGAFFAEFFGEDYRKTLLYDELDLLSVEEVDIGDDGSVEATRTLTWEEGPCTTAFVWAANGRPEFVETPGTPFVPGTGWQSLRNCPEPTLGLSLLLGGTSLAGLGRGRSRTRDPR